MINLYNFTVMAQRIEDGLTRAHACGLVAYLDDGVDLDKYGDSQAHAQYRDAEGYFKHESSYVRIGDKFMNDAGWVRKSSLADAGAIKFLGNA